jgi:hypothetical protein
VIDARVMAFCLGLSLVSTLLVGLVPALRVGGPRVAKTSRCTPARRARRATVRASGCGRCWSPAQIAMTLVLLIGAGLLIHSFVRLTSVSPGFESSGRDGVVQIVRVTLPEHLYDEPERIHAFARGVLDRIQYLPGVTSASLINSVPFGMMFIQGDFEIEGQPKPTLDVGTPKIDADYFRPWGFRCWRDASSPPATRPQRRKWRSSASASCASTSRAVRARRSAGACACAIPASG